MEAVGPTSLSLPVCAVQGFFFGQYLLWFALNVWALKLSKGPVAVLVLHISTWLWNAVIALVVQFSV